MKTFQEFLLEKTIPDTLLIEMPHILLGDKAVDLELEIKSKLKKEQIIQYFRDWLDGKPIQSKNPGFVQRLSKENIPVFVKDLLRKPFLKNFIEHHYDIDTWITIEDMLKSYLK